MVVADEAQIRQSLYILETQGQYIDPNLLPVGLPHTPTSASVPSCFSLLSAFFARLAGPSHAPALVATQESAASVAPKKKGNRLEQASEALSARVDTLHERASTLRATASSQFKVGDKRAALLSLKRAKAMEAQAEQASKAAMALEFQVEAIESAHVQAVASTALSSAVKKSQKVGRGLLAKTERACDQAAENADLQSDLASTLAEMAPGGADEDDELLEELNAMLAEEAPAPAPTTTLIAPAAPTTVPAISTAVMGRLPKTPTHGTRLNVPVPQGSALG